MTNHTAKVSLHYPTDQSMRANTNKAKCMDMVYIAGLMDLFIKASGKTITSMDMESTGGMMGEYMSESGKIIWFTARVNVSMRTAESTKASSKMT